MTSSIQSSKPYLDALARNSFLEAPPKDSQASAVVHAAASFDTTDVGMNDVYKSLTVLADKVTKKLDEILKADLPGGVASLKPEEHTPEKTAQRIVDGVIGLMSVYAKQNPEREGDELVSGFLDVVRGGIAEGYKDAVSVLKDIHALDIQGVQSGIEETMKLVEEKLTAFKTEWLKAQAPQAPKSEAADKPDGSQEG